MTDANTPAWLSNDNNNGGTDNNINDFTIDDALATTTTTPMSASTTNGAGASITSGGGGGDVDQPDLPGVILTMRLLNMGVAIYLIIISVLQFLWLPSLSKIVLSIYAICGGLLVCLLETQLKFLRVAIAVNFGFLFNSVWRFLFYILLGSVAWSFNSILGKIGGIAFLSVAVFNSYVLCRYPSYRKIREKIAEEEDRRIEARISKEVKKQAARQIMKT